MSRSRAEQILAEFTAVSGAARRPLRPPRRGTHLPLTLLLAGGAFLAVVLAGRTSTVQRPAAGASATPAQSGSVRPAPSAVLPPRPAGALWPSGLTPVVSCQSTEQPAGPDATGSAPYQDVAEPSIEAAFARWLEVDGAVVAFLPRTQWTKAEGSDGWARFDHVVDGVAKASVLFSAAPEGTDTRWSWEAAACDPAEFAPGVQVTGGVLVWTDASGRRVPTTEVLERDVCGNPNGPTILRVSGIGVFARDPAAAFKGRLLVPFESGVAIPSAATRTPYSEGGRQLWIGGDAKSAYVGSAASAERWPRLKNDDASVTDCS